MSKKVINDKRKKKSHPVISFIGNLIGICLILILLGAISLFSINLLMMFSTANNLWKADTLTGTHADYILVLGAGIEEDGEPSPILKERLDTALTLYQKEASANILVSGGSDDTESEVSVMKHYLEKKGVPSKAIKVDSHGVNTFTSVNNAYDEYGAEKLIIVSQKFHLYRAVYISEQLGISTYGCPCNEKSISDTSLRKREFFARVKDFGQLTLPHLPPPLSTLGDRIYQYAHAHLHR